MAAGGGAGRLLVVGRGVPTLASGERLELGGVSLDALREWVRGSLSERALREVHEQTQGKPAAI